MVYEYRHLHPQNREIRLLRLVSQEGRNGDSENGPEIIQATLEHASLEDKPDYIALSYTWGDPNRTKPILLDGTPVEVTENLVAALRWLIRDDISALWIDAVCINQRDNEEKSWQVQQMRDVYQRAKAVIIWLGPGADDSEYALGAMSNIAERTVDPSKPFDWGDIWRALAQEASDDTNSFRNTTLERVFSDLGIAREGILLTPIAPWFALLKRQWWHRVWVMQEIAVADEFWFTCGDNTLYGRKMQIALDLFRHYYLHVMTSKPVDPSEWSPAAKELLAHEFDLRPWVMMDNWHKSEDNDRTLLTILHKAMLPPERRMEATNPRDFIYALLGIASDAESLGISPDYSKSCQDVYTDVAHKLIENGQIVALSYCQLPKGLPDLPSWVPDWPNLRHHPLQPPWTSGEKSKGLKRFAAAADTTVCCSFRFRKGSSYASPAISGYRVDNIRQLGRIWTDLPPTAKDLEPHDHPYMQWLLDITDMAESSPSMYETQEARAEAVWRTALTDKDPSQEGMLGKAGISPLDTFHELLKGQLYDRVHFNCLGIMEGVRKGRRSFKTKRGYIGLGPEAMRPGDLVVIFKGAEVPYVIREVQNGFRLIGEAYIHGLMYGEFLKGLMCEELFVLL
ncbi:HET-domain-containing protein [Lepidopterella palustris CBS 459.81]|uniref:HET-domain-containing protein n=1 Tax=Lepidopterella palustris CBS 459.81 TaxID=1314670 RepID=A0A8E2EAA5_9PEZI|nr:HET-domain-containing protein [Lepidopterella palustris CBS 459.81]